MSGQRQEYVHVIIFGKPQPQGSTKAFAVKNRAYITDSNKNLRPWRQQVSLSSMFAMKERGQKCLDRSIPVKMTVDFFFDKPKSTKRSILHKVTRPDLSKLTRAVEDGMTGIVFADDSQVVESYTFKHFGQPERTEVSVEILPENNQ
jgi:Holliday junction resolvase RusA-like endonuclease